MGLDPKSKRALSRGMALADFKMIGEVFYHKILGEGPMGNDEVRVLIANEEARKKAEEQNYSDCESEREDLEDEN